jgi:hypothetical protein
MTARIGRVDGAQALELAGIVAAVVLAAVVNVLAARHFTRWDWTRDRRWSLSPATLETLHSLDAREVRVTLWVIAGEADPVEGSLRQLLAAYDAATSRLDVHWIDPDRDAVQLVDLQRRFGLEAGRAEDGRVATDAIVIAASGDRHWFLTQAEMFEQSDDVHVKPREERALTQAIRSVLGGAKTRLCFTVGHGELALDPGKDERESLGAVRDLLEKDNYEVASVDTTPPDAHEPFAGCAVAIVAGPRSAFSPDEASRLRAWVLQGGNLLAAVGPADASTATGLAPVGLDDVLAPFGIGLDEAVVHDVDPSVAAPDTHGEGFLVTPLPHAITAGLLPGAGDARPPRVAMFFARPLHHVAEPGAASATDLLVTGASAFSKTSIAGASSWRDAPPREPDDRGGPFVLAMASERPGPAASAHGPRVVVVGSRFALAADNWRQPHALHGTAFFVDSAISWLAARATVVDVPDGAEVAAAMRISEEGRDEVRRYVLLFMPLATVLLGVAVWAWRRSSENVPYDGQDVTAGKADDTTSRKEPP